MAGWRRSFRRSCSDQRGTKGGALPVVATVMMPPLGSSRSVVCGAHRGRRARRSRCRHLMIDEIHLNALPCVSRLHTHSQPHHSEDTVPTSPNYSRPAAHKSRKPRTTRPRAGRVGPRKNAGCLGWGGSKRDTGAPDRPTRHQGGPPPDRPTGCSVLPRSWKPPSINPPEGRAKPLPPGAPCRADQTAPRAQISQQPPARKPNCLGSVSSEKN